MLIPAAVPDSPERQEVGGVAGGAVGWPGAEEPAGATLLPAGEAGGRGGACGRGQRLGGCCTPNPGRSGKAKMEQRRSCRPIVVLLAWGMGAAVRVILAQKTPYPSSLGMQCWPALLAPALARCRQGFTGLHPVPVILSEHPHCSNSSPGLITPKIVH